MKSFSFGAALRFAQDTCSVVLGALAIALRWLPDASLPRVALAALGLAIILPAVPLGIFLFIVFLIVKLIATAVIVQRVNSQQTTMPGHGEDK